MIYGIIGGISAVFVVTIYNRLVTLRNRLKNAFSQIDVQLKRRHDLIPNLVESVRGYLKHESATLDAVVSARAQAETLRSRTAENPTQGEMVRELSRAEGILGQSLGRLVAVMEAYPDLKASATVAKLMEELSSTENRVAFSRQAYNDAVMEYNIAREKFPNNLLAGVLGMNSATGFEIEAPSEKLAPRVSLT